MAEQMELFGADTGWFHIFRSMIDSGDCAKLGPYAVVVYMVNHYLTWSDVPIVERPRGPS